MLLDAAQQNTVHCLYNSDFLGGKMWTCALKLKKKDFNNVSSVIDTLVLVSWAAVLTRKMEVRCFSCEYVFQGHFTHDMPANSHCYWIVVFLLKIWCLYFGQCVFVRDSGARGGADGWGTALQAGRSWVRFPMVSLEFFIDIILPAVLWSWGWLNL